MNEIFWASVEDAAKKKKERMCKNVSISRMEKSFFLHLSDDDKFRDV